jgi:hypothetical protein
VKLYQHFHTFMSLHLLIASVFFAWVALHEEDPFDAMLSEIHLMYGYKKDEVNNLYTYSIIF